MEENRTRNFEPIEIEPGRQVALFLTGWLGFQLMAMLLQFIFLAIFKYIPDTTNSLFNMTVNCTAYALLFTALLFIVTPLAFKDLLKGFKKLTPYVAGIACLVAILSFNFVYGIILSFIKVPVSDNVNEQNIETMTKMYFLPSLIFFGIIGPVCEELTYRVGLFSLGARKSKFLGYIITIVVFAFIHFNFEPDSLVNELLNLPYYAFAALAFSFTYDKFGFAGSVTGHILNNLLSIVSTYLLTR